MTVDTNKALIRVDLHCHSVWSPDSLNWIPVLLRQARSRGLDRLAITDHNCIAGALQAQALAPDLVIVGEEILTTSGEVLALFVKEFVPPFLTPEETVRRLRAQGAFISLSHPFDHQRHGWRLEELEELVPWLDAVEVANARVGSKQVNQRAQEFAARHGLAGTAGSDAHMPFEVGRFSLELPAFDSPETLRLALGRAKLYGDKSPAWVHLFSRYAYLYKKVFKRKTRILLGIEADDRLENA